MNKLVELADRVYERRTGVKVHRGLKYDLLTIGINAQGNPFVWYQTFPALMGQGHHVNGVNHFVDVNPNEPLLEIPSDFFYCVDCKLMGRRRTFEMYKCIPQGIPEWKTCSCDSCKIQRTFRKD